jgi:hypothetical protein
MLRGKLCPKELVDAIIKRKWNNALDGGPIVHLEIPGRWITAHLDRDGSWVPIPRWSA